MNGQRALGGGGTQKSANQSQPAKVFSQSGATPKINNQSEARIWGPTMNFLPAAVTASHLLILLLFFIATLDKGWWVLSDARTLNLWYDCAPQNRSQGWECSSLGLSPLLRGVQGLMVAALLLSALGLLLFLWQLLGGPRGRLFLPSAAAQLLAGLAALVGAGLFAAWAVRAGDGHAGHCPTLAGLGGALALASGGGYLRLRTRE
ncbi:epithelial membrane protein 3-like isoform X3 [Chamaea fasciata]|uniref:epithelial membrane protein 3-like isoform X3 n=1 Tax=Chamaea fasciata TaxID=190680 RepID=UPI00336A8752